MTDRPRYFFLHAPSGESWEVADPIRWCLEHARHPVLERARERLVMLGPAPDPQRVVRLVVRRCQLNLLELLPGRVVAHHWGEGGRADLRPFFKEHSLARQGVEVFRIDRKREVVTLQHGDDFLFGGRLPPDPAWEAKWQRRGEDEPDDWGRRRTPGRASAGRASSRAASPGRP